VKFRRYLWAFAIVILSGCLCLDIGFGYWTQHLEVYGSTSYEIVYLVGEDEESEDLRKTLEAENKEKNALEEDVEGATTSQPSKKDTVFDTVEVMPSETQPIIQAEDQPEGEPDNQTENQADTQTEAESVTQTNTLTDVQTEDRTTTQTVNQPEDRTDIQTCEQPEDSADIQTVNQPEDRTTTQTGEQPEDSTDTQMILQFTYE